MKIYLAGALADCSNPGESLTAAGNKNRLVSYLDFKSGGKWRMFGLKRYVRDGLINKDKYNQKRKESK